jgi:transposase
MEESKKRFVGLDLAKRRLEECIVCEGEKTLRHGGIKSDAAGRLRLAGILRPGDVAGMEAPGYAFMLTRFLEREAGCTVYILHPKKLRVIWDSTKKTDKEDAQKTAKYIQRTPEQEMPRVSLPTEKEEELRGLIRHKQAINRERTALINRLHALYVQAGHTTLKKKDVAGRERRQAAERLLENGWQRETAQSIERGLESVEKEREEFENKIRKVVEDSELSPYLMSIPGVGPNMAAAFPAYAGDGSRFSKAGEVASCAGLTPVPGCSGDTERCGHIAQSGCKALRSIVVQAAWAAGRSASGGELRRKFIELPGRKGKTKSAIAIARRIIELMWILVVRREFYAYASKEQLVKKFRAYKLNTKGWEALAS